MKNENEVINGLWLGSNLSVIEQLTIASFLAHGHKFRLWLYHPVWHIPLGTDVCDGNEILPAKDVWCYPNGSFAGFSDLFRYRLLHKYGGWWTDMDVCCLHQFDFEAPYVFRPHWHVAIGNIMKVPQGCELMQKCWDETSPHLNVNNRDWELPLRIFGNNVRTLNLEQYIVAPDVLGHDSDWLHYFAGLKLPSHALHWCRAACLGHKAELKEGILARRLIKEYLGQGDQDCSSPQPSLK